MFAFQRINMIIALLFQFSTAEAVEIFYNDQTQYKHPRLNKELAWLKNVKYRLYKKFNAFGSQFAFSNWAD